MDKALKKLFEFQLFERNPRIDALMSETAERQSRVLSDDELKLVSAAGDMSVNSEKDGE